MEFNLNSLLLGIVNILLAGNGFLFYKQNKTIKEVNITDKIQQIAAQMVELQQVQIVRLETKYGIAEDELADLKTDLDEQREYILRDAAWHYEVLQEIARLNGKVSSPPTLATKTRRYRRKGGNTNVQRI